MEIRYSRDPHSFTRMNTTEIRDEFMVANLFAPNEIKLVYLHVDRLILGSAVPGLKPLTLEAGKELAADYFAQRRETGVFNTGGDGMITVDGQEYKLGYQDMLYIGRGSREIVFSSADAEQPARFYLISLPAHQNYPTTRITKNQANAVALGSKAEANERIIYQYVREGGVSSCQLVMGFTELATGSVWNTMPAHTHERRSEVYLYFNLSGDNVVFHLLGQPQETRHIVVRNGQVAISPSWSIHAGAGTSNYCFVWAMGGENQAFSDMDLAPMVELG
ncbi:MAG: 5-dehydro-4-deoxy-D-glucuronate isomerase [Anaerolineae bacterium]|nr:5-dehydro-4-deoxy-D-glucuronate isomerase [Anaerolineae bacterium]